MAIKTVISTGGNWNTAATWEPAGIPATADYVVLGATSGNLTIPTTYSTTVAGLEVNPSYTGTFSHNGSTNLLTISGTTCSLILQPNLRLVRSSTFMVALSPTSTQTGTLQTNGLTLSNFWSIGSSTGGTVSLLDTVTFSSTYAIQGPCVGNDIILNNITSFTPPSNLVLRAPNKVYIRGNTTSTITHTNGPWSQSHFVYDIPPSVRYSLPSVGIRLGGPSGSIIEFNQRPEFIGAGTWSGLPLMTPQTGISSPGAIFDGTDTIIMSENFTWGAFQIFTPGMFNQTMPYQEKRFSFPKGLSTSNLVIYGTPNGVAVNRFSTASIISSGGTITASNVQVVGLRNNITTNYLGTASNACYLRLSPDNNYVFGDFQSSTYPSIDNVIMSITPSVPVNITITGETALNNTELRDINLVNKRVLVGDSVTLTRSTGFINNINTSYTYIT